MIIEIKYTETLKQIIAIVIIPVFFILGFIAFAVFLKKYNISDSIMDVIIFGGSFLMIGLSVFIILRIIFVDGELDYNESGIHFKLYKKSFLFQQDDFFINYENIESASINEDESGRSIGTIKLRSPSKTILVMADKIVNTDNFVEYWIGLENQFNTFTALLYNKK